MPMLRNQFEFARIVLLAGLATVALSLVDAKKADAAAPVLTDFAVDSLGGGWWELWGFVDDEDPDYCEVYFSGLLSGYSVDVSSTGEFSLLVYIPQGNSGTVFARALDPEYEWSDERSDYISNN